MQREIQSIISNANLGSSNVVGKIFIVGRRSRKDEKHGMAHKCNTMFHAGYNLFSHPLCNQVITKDNYGWSGHKPECIEAEKGVIEPTLKE